MEKTWVLKKEEEKKTKRLETSDWLKKRQTFSPTEKQDSLDLSNWEVGQRKTRGRKRQDERERWRGKKKKKKVTVIGGKKSGREVRCVSFSRGLTSRSRKRMRERGTGTQVTVSRYTRVYRYTYVPPPTHTYR